jgi:hypothetical protein
MSVEPRFAPAEAGAAPTSPGYARAIEDFLVCTGDGRVLYESGCRNSDLWVNFLEFLSQKSRRLAQGLPIGAFQRLEATEDRNRLVAILGENRGVVVRSREEMSSA